MAVSPAWVNLPERYSVSGHIANGGMASVWEAKDELLGRDVAVKLLAPHLGADEKARERFLREARTAATVSQHPHVVTIYDVGEHEGQSFIVMELYRGGSVGDRLRRAGPPGHDVALRWLRETAGALDAAHAAGIVHRDIKPANLLLDEQDRLAVADFGIARLALEDQLTMTGQVLGTAAYIAPEMAVGDPATPASDRYALAIVAYELLTGGRPFQAEHFAAQARMHIEEPPPAAGLGEKADAVLQRGMAKDPERRWESCAELVEVLEEALTGESHTATVPMPPTAEHRPVAAAVPAAAPAPPPARTAAPPRRPLAPAPAPAVGPPRPWGRIGAVLALLAVLALAAIALGGALSGEDEPATKAEATPEATAEARETPVPQETPAAQEKTPAPAAGGGGSIADARRLHNQAFAANNGGDHAQAIELEQQALAICSQASNAPEDPCGYALYEIGKAYNRSGNPEQAIPFLQQRLERYGDNSAGDVQRELDAAQGGGKGKPKKSKDADKD